MSGISLGGLLATGTHNTGMKHGILATNVSCNSGVKSGDILVLVGLSN